MPPGLIFQALQPEHGESFYLPCSLAVHSVPELKIVQLKVEVPEAPCVRSDGSQPAVFENAVKVQWEIRSDIVSQALQKIGPCAPLFSEVHSTSVSDLCVMSPADADYSRLSFSGQCKFVNAPHARLGDVLAQYLAQKAVAPASTSAVFVVPEWPTRK